MKIRGLIVMAALAAVASISQAQAPAAPAPDPKGAVPGNAAVSPQGAGESSDDNPVATFRVPVNEVNVIFTVTDKHGRFIKNLTRDDFTVLDDKKPPKSIDLFRSETDLPLRVGLLVDASNSIRDRFLFEQQAAATFLRQIVRPQTDKAFVLAFDEASNITQDFTNDQDKLAHGIKVIRPGGGTAMWDAVYNACKDKLMNEHAENNQTLRKALVVVSDGDDNQSRVTRQQAIEMAQHAGVIIYAISTNLSNIHDSGDHNLKALAEATGGRAFYPFKLHDLTEAFRNIREELRSQYAISYKPQQFEANGQYRPIQIAAQNKHYRVRAKKGYFVPKATGN